jgi:hypothetical protein
MAEFGNSIRLMKFTTEACRSEKQPRYTVGRKRLRRRSLREHGTGGSRLFPAKKAIGLLTRLSAAKQNAIARENIENTRGFITNNPKRLNIFANYTDGR